MGGGAGGYWDEILRRLKKPRRKLEIILLAINEKL